MHSLFLTIVFTEAFPAPPVLLYGYYSCFNFVTLRVAMLKDMSRKFCVKGVSKNFPKIWTGLCKMVRVAL